MISWVGPFKVIDALSQLFIIEHLITKVRHDVHSSCLKFYADSSLDIIEEMMKHVQTKGFSSTPSDSAARATMTNLRAGNWRYRGKVWRMQRALTKAWKNCSTMCQLKWLRTLLRALSTDFVPQLLLCKSEHDWRHGGIITAMSLWSNRGGRCPSSRSHQRFEIV